MKKFFIRYKSYIAAGLSFVAALAAGYMLQLSEIKRAEEKTDLSQAFITEGEAESATPKVNEELNEKKAEVTENAKPITQESNLPEPENEAVSVAKASELNFAMPVDGEISKPYSKLPVYSITLDDWRSHEGVDIEAAEGDAVFSAEKGCVTNVGRDPLLGVYIRIDHGNGTETLYASLHSETTVQEGQNIEKHHQIGYVGKTSVSEGAQNPHIHFEIKVNGRRENPEEYIKK